MIINSGVLRHFAPLAAAMALAACGVAPSTQTTGAATLAAQVPAKTDFNGVWEIAALELVVRPDFGKPPYTPAAQKWVDDYGRLMDPKVDDPAQFCDVKGMPWTFLSRARTYPVEIYQTPERVVVFFEIYDQSRNIRNGEVAPKSLPASLNGYSVARWDAASLVITTTSLAERPFPNRELRSEQMTITERWTRKVDPKIGDVIEIDMDIEDPVIYAKPVKARQILKRAPAGTVVGSYNCTEKLWLAHTQKKLGKAPEKK